MVLLYDRFQRIPGTDQQALTQATIDLIGAGGLGGEVGHGLVRKGIGRLNIFDHDHVDISNLARQHFTRKDVGKPKALALAHNLSREATAKSIVEGYAHSFQDALTRGARLNGQIAVVGVDNHATRIAAAHHYLRHGIPVIFLAVDIQAACGYVFVQQSQPGTPCFLCLFPDALHDHRVYGCAGSSIEILKIVAGVALYAVDSLLMDRPRPWNYKSVFLNRPGDGQQTIGQRLDCPLCQKAEIAPVTDHA